MQDRPDIFTLSDSHLKLGVGKNMGQAIRYWCTAFKLIEPVKLGRNRSSEYRPTAFGVNLLSSQGWDPWLEDPASLWMLHWNLVKPPCIATAWDIVFNDIRKSEFSSENILAELVRFRNQNGLKISESSLQKDVQCILRMYTEQLKDKPISDENIACPFVELKLIQRSGDSGLHQFRHGPKLSLPSEIIVAAALEFVSEVSLSQKTISLSNLTFATGGPGQIFKLTESAVYTAVDDMATKCEEISISDMAGVIQMSFRSDALTLASEILDTYYGKN